MSASVPASSAPDPFAPAPSGPVPPSSVPSAFFTQALHAGLAPDPTTGAILTPIYQSTTYVLDAVGQDRGFTYSRSGNPTVAALERNLGELEGGLPATCFATGMAALTTLCLALLKSGDRVVATDVVYGGSFRLLTQVFDGLGIESEFVDTASPELLERALVRPARLVLLESPANPTLKLADIAACAALSRRAGVLVVVDNTFLTPCLQRPLDLGADVVLHSTTKYLDGHNATVGGALVTRDPALAERFFWTRQAVGTIQSPFNAWLTLQGIKTLPLRMERHGASALAIASHLEQHSRVASVSYPGLESFPQRDLARRQQGSGGGIVAFEVEGGVEAGIRLLNALELCSLAENLGSAETLVTHPATMTHAAMPAATRRAIGIGDGLIRLSVGLEDTGDLIADLEQALKA